MGGNAFKTALPDARFPRMKPSVYNGLKGRLATRLQGFYEHVAVPREAPGKQDYGDVDFIVCQPRTKFSPEDVQTALGAVQSITFDHNFMTNFAIQSVDYDESATSDDFYQVDVQVCDSVEKWERAVFFTSFGDLGMILGLIARAHGLSLGRNGLKLAKPLPTSPPVSFHLSQSFPLILDFLDVSMDQWGKGFSSEHEIFSWLAASRLFDPTRMLRSEGTASAGKIKTRDIRPMYQNFLEFVRTRTAVTPRAGPGDILNEAIDFFGKRPLYTVLIRIADIKSHFTTNFSGTVVRQWTGLQGMPIRFVMDEVRRQLGGDELVIAVNGIPLDSLPSGDISSVHLTLRAWESTMSGMSAEEIKEMVVRVKEELDAEGKLDFDWRAVKQQKAEKKQRQEVASNV